MVSKYIEKLQLEIHNQDMEIHKLKRLLEEASSVIKADMLGRAIHKCLINRCKEAIGLGESNGILD